MFNARASGGKYRRCTAIGPMYNLALEMTLSDSFIGFETARGRARLNRVGWQFFWCLFAKRPVRKICRSRDFCGYVFGMAASALKSLAWLEE
jgi:hypothetical protein